jgi:sec-independent protein translocase protein TatB
MLDFGFSEILLTSAIALVVLGPERLPKVARQVGNWMGRARVMARQLTEQLEREVSADELIKQQLKTSVPAPAAPTALASPMATAATVAAPTPMPAPATDAPPAIPATELADTAEYRAEVNRTSVASMHPATPPPQPQPETIRAESSIPHNE